VPSDQMNALQIQDPAHLAFAVVAYGGKITSRSVSATGKVTWTVTGVAPDFLDRALDDPALRVCREFLGALEIIHGTIALHRGKR
jgi:hypothetical protein